MSMAKPIWTSHMNKTRLTPMIPLNLKTIAKIHWSKMVLSLKVVPSLISKFKMTRLMKMVINLSSRALKWIPNVRLFLSVKKMLLMMNSTTLLKLPLITWVSSLKLKMKPLMFITKYSIHLPPKVNLTLTSMEPKLMVECSLLLVLN